MDEDERERDKALKGGSAVNDGDVWGSVRDGEEAGEAERARWVLMARQANAHRN